MEKQFDLLSEESKLLRHQNQGLLAQNFKLRQISSFDKIDRSLAKFNSTSEEFSNGDIDRSELASITCIIIKNTGNKIDFTRASVKEIQTSLKTKKSSCSECTQKGLLFQSIPKAKKAKKNLIRPEPKESKSMVMTKSKPRIVNSWLTGTQNLVQRSI